MRSHMDGILFRRVEPPATSWWVGCSREEFRARLAREDARLRRNAALLPPSQPEPPAPPIRRTRAWRDQLAATVVEEWLG